MSTGQTANLSNGTRQNGRPDSNSGKTMLLMPFVWPQNKPLLQLLCAVAGICLLVERALVLLVPLQLGRVVDALIEKPGIFVALWLLDTSGGIPMLCKCIWFPLEDNFYLRIGTAIFDKILTLPGDFHAKTNPANLWESVTRGVSVRYLVRSFVFHIIPTAVDISVAIVVLCYIFSIYMAMVFTAVVIVLFWVSYKMLPRLLGKQERLISDMENEHKCLYQATSNWQTTVYFNRIQHEKLRFRSAIANRMGSSASFSLGVHLECLARSCLLSGGLFGLYLLAAYQIAWGRKSLGSFVMLVFYWSRLSSHLQVLPSVIRDTTLGILNARELVARLSIEPSICNLKDAKPLLVDRGGVDFRDVGFTYAGQKQSLSHVDFQVEGGQTVAIVGESGSGKSSLSKLLLRMYDPAHGTIFIDGQNIQSVTLESLRDSVGVVPQEPAIFHDTIMNNVKYSNIFARDEQVYEACKVVGLHGLFMSFQEGYQTFLGEYGVSLSSGERQRMGIARIILRDPKILFLDEVMNNVDSNTESIVLQALKKLYMGRTIFIVSHRLSTIASADKILVFRRGRVVEQGDHNSLLAANGYYSCLWSHLARPKPPTSAVKVLGKKSQPAGTPLATREVNRIPLGRGEDPNDPVDLSMSNVGKWFLHKANERAKQKEISHLATGSPGGNFADVSPFQRTILKPDAPEFIPFAQRHSAESRDRHTGSCTNENQHTGTSEQFPEHNQVGKENMRQTPHPLTVRETLSPLVDGNVVSYTAHGGMSNDSTASVLQQVDNGVVLAYPRKARKRTRKSKRRAAVRRKLTESEPVEVGFGHEPYMLPT
ncbi:hypothetical protein EYZ11_001540 [Aspergillus tanneri]|uniref:ABC transporter domain-containing protein n=1 Tax=Aspergillus tanneri TaxID=1220188 RepID=A0A4S3JUD4_9EURO|nr:hypothetical protein EYZ11_001540 [Aspergillus tanneri]